MQGTSRNIAVSLCLALALPFVAAHAQTKSAASVASSGSSSSNSSAAAASAAAASASGSDKSVSTLQTALKKAKSSYQAGQYREAETSLGKLSKGAKSIQAEEATVMLADVELRLNKPDQSLAAIARFRRTYAGSAFTARVNYYQGHASLRQNHNAEAAKAFAAAALATPPNQALYGLASKALWHIADNGGLTPEEMESILETLEKDPTLRSGLMERMGDQYLHEGRYQAARNAYEDWIFAFGKTEAAGRIKDKLKQATDAPSLNRTMLLMAPMTGEFAEIGKALKEGAQLAVDESNQKGLGRVETRILDDQGNLIVGIHRLRKTMREEKIDAVLGPAMSDVSAAAAVDLSARKSPVPMVTPTATTHGIAALGEGIFQLNVTTGTLGQKIAAYAVGCLKLKDFAIVAPNSEYGSQLADAFQKTVEKKGGTVLTVQYFDADNTDLSPQFNEIRKLAIKSFFEKKREAGEPEPDAKAYAKALSDSVLPIDGIFLPATNGEEAYKLAGQAAFNKLRSTILGSSGWNDKAMIHKTSTTVIQGAYFSVDFQENPKTEAWTNFQRAYSAKWKRQPDKVAALAYDGAKFLLQGMTAAGASDQLIPSLKAIHSFNGVMGRIVFDDKYGANANAAIYHVEKKGFKEVESCPEAD